MLYLNRDLARRLEEGLQSGNRETAKAWNALSSESAVRVLEVGDGLAIYGGAGCPVNEAVGLGMSSAVDETALLEIERFYAAHGHRSVIRVCSLAHPTLFDVIRKRGYVLGNFAYRFVLELPSWRSPFDKADVRVRKATGDEELAWARTVFMGFADDDRVPEDREIELERSFFRMAGVVPMIAVEGGQPAAGGAVAIGDEVAALFAASTLRSYRRRGLQTALLDGRLRLAKARGASIATVETDPGSDSQRNVERMGFRLAYAAVQMTRP